MTSEVIVAPKPFTPRVERVEVAEGITVAEILHQACSTGVLDPQDLPRTEVYIDGERLVNRQAALRVTPHAGEVVNVVVLPHGGGGHGKNPLEIALQIAVMVAAFVVTGPGGPLAASLASAGITGATAAAIEVAAAAAINITGAIALSAIFGSSNTSGANQPNYALQGSSNQVRLRGSMPLCLGQRRWSFDVAGTAFSSINGADTFLTVMFAVHYGPCTVTDIKIGETLLSAYPTTEYQIEYFLTPGPRHSLLYPTQVDQQTFQNDLDPLHADWTTETSGVNTTVLELDLYWPELFYTSSGGEEKNQDSVVYMEYSPYGLNTWLPVPGYPAGTDADGNAYPTGSFWISGNTHNPTRRTVTWTVAAGQYDVRLGRRIRRGGDTSRSVDDVYWTALRSINSAEPAIADQTLSLIVIKVMASQDFDGDLGTVSGVVTPIAPIYNASSESWLGDATTYDAVHWQPTSNVAALARYLMTGYPAAKPLAAAEIDASFGTQYTLIETMNWHGGQLQTDDSSQSDLLVKLGKMGRCFFYWNGQALCCVPDYEKPAPRQLFSGRNAQGYKYKRVFPDPVHAVFVQFVDADEDYKEDGIFVYNDGYSAANASLFEGLTLDYACTINRAQREGRVYLAKRQLLVETHEWTAGIDAVASTFGDRVAVRHISTLFGIGEARVQFRRWAGALISGVRLDGEVTFQAGQTYAIDVRRSDQVLRGVALTTVAGTTRDLVFSTPLIVAQAPEKGDLIVIGETTTVTEDVELVDVQPQADGSVQLVAQKYDADAIVAAETGAIAALQSQLTARVAAPVPTILGANGDPNGVVVAFDVLAQRQTPIKGFTARYRRSPTQDAASTWSTLPTVTATARQVRTPPIPQAQVLPGGVDTPYNVDVEIRTVLTTSEVSQPAQALNIIVQKGIYAPTDFAALGVVRTAPDGSSYPAIQISCDAVVAGATQDLVIELQPTGASPPAWRASASGPFHGDNPNGDLTDVLGASIYDIRARWRTSDNWYSEFVSQTNVSIPSGALVSSSTAALGGVSAEEVLADVQAAAGLATTLSAQLQTQADTEVAAALQAASALLTAHAYSFTPDGLPLGPFTKNVATMTAQAIEFISIMGQLTPDGLGIILNQQGVYYDGTTLLSEKLDQLSSATGAVAANLSDNYLTATSTTSAIADASLSLKSYVDDGVGTGLTSLSATLSNDYLTSIQTNGAISTAVAASALTLNTSIGNVSNNLSNNYYNAITTDGRIMTAVNASALTLNTSIGNVSTNLSNNYYNAITTDGRITTAVNASALTLNTSIGDVSTNLSNNYLTTIQTGSAISSATSNLSVSNSGTLGAYVTTQATALQSVQGAFSGTLAFSTGSGGSVTSLALISTSGGTTSASPLSEVLISAGVFIITDQNGKPVISIVDDVVTLDNLVVKGSTIELGGVNTAQIAENAVSQVTVSHTQPNSIVSNSTSVYTEFGSITVPCHGGILEIQVQAILSNTSTNTNYAVPITIVRTTDSSAILQSSIVAFSELHGAYPNVAQLLTAVDMSIPGTPTAPVSVTYNIDMVVSNKGADTITLVDLLIIAKEFKR